MNIIDRSFIMLLVGIMAILLYNPEFSIFDYLIFEEFILILVIFVLIWQLLSSICEWTLGKMYGRRKKEDESKAPEKVETPPLKDIVEVEELIDKIPAKPKNRRRDSYYY